MKSILFHLLLKTKQKEKKKRNQNDYYSIKHFHVKTTYNTFYKLKLLDNMHIHRLILCITQWFLTFISCIIHAINSKAHLISQIYRLIGIKS